MKYVILMLNRGIIHECHLWDFTRNMQDHKYVNGLSDGSDERIKLMHVDNKCNFNGYYKFYSSAYQGLDVIIVKCDDDIVYIDVDAMPAFLAFRDTHRDHFICLPEIINNGLCAHYMQRQDHVGLCIPPCCPHTFEQRDGGFESLVSDASKALWLHEWFLDRERGRSRVGHILLGHRQRISINMFAMMSKDLHLLGEPGVTIDDEAYLSTSLPARLDRCNSVFTGLTVSHFGFSPQRRNGLIGTVENRLLERYDTLASQEMCSVVTSRRIT